MSVLRSVIYLAVAALIGVSLEGAIVEVNDLSEFKRTVEALDRTSIVLFDLDYTLLVPCDAALLPCGRHLQKDCLHGLDQEHRERLQSIIALESEEKVTDIDFLEIIKQLQEREIAAIGLTALCTGTYGKIQNLENWRLAVLKKLGIDFSQSFSQINSIIFNNLPQRDDNYPLFKEGVLFTHRQNKGKVLAAFIELLDNKPGKIVVIDDSLRYLKMIEQAANELGIKCCSFHYRAAERLGGHFNEAVGKFQFQYLVEQEHWLSENQVQELQGQQ